MELADALDAEGRRIDDAASAVAQCAGLQVERHERRPGLERLGQRRQGQCAHRLAANGDIESAEQDVAIHQRIDGNQFNGTSPAARSSSINLDSAVPPNAVSLRCRIASSSADLRTRIAMPSDATKDA